MRNWALAATAAIAIATTVSPVAAATIDVSASGNNSGGASFWTSDNSFVLPTGFTGASLNITDFGADDRAVLQLNGTVIDMAGIFGPGNGSFSFDGSAPTSYTFVRGNGARDLTLTGPFVRGSNLLRVIVNDTGSGISGGFTNGPGGPAGPTGFAYTASVTYNAAGAVPEPATWAMMIGGIGMAGGMMRRHRANVRTTVSFA